MEVITPLVAFEVTGRYPLYFRQALRFIIEIGGEEALARFEHIMSNVFYDQPETLSEELNAVKKVGGRNGCR